MISYRHIVTYGTGQHRWLSNVTDLALAGIGAEWMLFAVNATGGVSTYRLGDPLTPLERAHYTTPHLASGLVATLNHGAMASSGSVLRRCRIWSKPIRNHDLA